MSYWIWETSQVRPVKGEWRSSVSFPVIFCVTDIEIPDFCIISTQPLKSSGFSRPLALCLLEKEPNMMVQLIFRISDTRLFLREGPALHRCGCIYNVSYQTQPKQQLMGCILFASKPTSRRCLSLKMRVLAIHYSLPVRELTLELHLPSTELCANLCMVRDGASHASTA